MAFGVALAAFISVFGGMLWRLFLLLGFAILYEPGAEQFPVPFGAAVLLQFMRAPLNVVVVLLCVVVCASSVFGVFVCFLPPSSPFISLPCLLLFISVLHLVLLLLFILLFFYCYYFHSAPGSV